MLWAVWQILMSAVVAVLNVVKKSGSWFSYGETKLGQGRDAVKQLLDDNPELMEEIEVKVKEAIAAKQQ